MAKFANYVNSKHQSIIPVENGSIERLEKLVHLVASGEVRFFWSMSYFHCLNNFIKLNSVLEIFCIKIIVYFID